MPPIGVHHTATVDQPWDGPANEARMSNDAGAATFRKEYAWVDPNADADTKAAYKFPHHQVGADGSVGAANLAGCRNGLSRLPQANVPDGDRGGIESHLNAHLSDGTSAAAFEVTPVALSGTEPPLFLELTETSATLPVRSYRHVSRAFYNRAWAIDQGMLRELSRILQGRLGGIRFSEEEIAKRLAAAEEENGPRMGATKLGSVAVLPMYGAISDRMNLMSDISGGTSTAEMTQLLRQALADDSISAIVFDIDSPGGVTDGAPEFAAELRRAKSVKPVVGVVNTMAASAAYWYGSQMSELVATPSGEVGSIGVYAAHTDMSAANEAAGMKVSYISAGPFKTEGNPDEPLTDEGRQAIQEQVDDFYDMFVADVAKGRATTPDVVRETYGQGRTLLARKALAAGMVDRIDTLETTVRRLQRKPATAGNRRGEDVSEPRLALVAEAEGYIEPIAAAAALPSSPLRPDPAWNRRMKGHMK